VGHVVFLPTEHDLGVARDLDLARMVAFVGKRKASYLDVLTSSWDSMPSSVRRKTARSFENVTRYSSGSCAMGWYVADQSRPDRTSRR
jgi:hypothetical protein